MSNIIVTRHSDDCKEFDPNLSRLLDEANQREEHHAEAAVEHFIQWKRHLQEASTARAERRALEASVWADRQAA